MSQRASSLYRFSRTAVVSICLAVGATGCSNSEEELPVVEDTGSADTGADAAAEVAPDTGADTESDAGPDTAPDTTVAPDTAPEADAIPDVAPDTAPDTAVADADAAVDAPKACASPSECPGVDTDCLKRQCSAGVCGFSSVADGTAITAQTAGDCKRVVCNGAGSTKAINDDTDLPNDAKDCTVDACAAGIPTHSNKAARATCTEGGTLCDGAGACVECLTNPDCASGVCNTTTKKCETTSCGDGIKNGTETDVDCGGTCSTKCARGKGCTEGPDCVSTRCNGFACVECNAAAECPSGVCVTGSCLPPACNDLVKNGTESDVDCGGSCATKCANGKTCSAGGDCASTRCNGTTCVECTLPSQCASLVCTAGACIPAACPDGVKNGDETDLDCGGTCATKCADGKVCGGDPDCASTHCAGSVCVECTLNTHCATGVCNTTTRTCIAATCLNGMKDGTETDVDCGGPSCNSCAPSKDCNAPSDCQTGVCTALGKCAAPMVVSITPADGATSIATTSTIAIAFSAMMNSSTATAQTSSGPCTGSVQVSTDSWATCIGITSPIGWSPDGTTATLTPLPQLSYVSTYRVRVTLAVTDAFGNALDAPYESAGFTTAAPVTSCPVNSVVISQVYGGGGNAGATYKNDFIELHNRGATEVDLAGWSVQYASSSGSTWSVTPLTGKIAAGGYYLVQQAAGAGGTVDLAPNDMGAIAMSAVAGKVALSSASTALTGSCPSGGSLVDFVGFGTANCGEGSTMAPAPSNTNSISRARSGCRDSGSNAADFTAGAASPRNKLTTARLCTCGTANESGVSDEVDYCNVQSPTSLTRTVLTSSGTIYARLYEAGTTEAAGAPAGVTAQVGFGPDNVNPTTQSGGWTWVPATYNAGFVDASNDEFQGSFTTPLTPGKYRYGYRMSLDGGASWTYCDLNGAGSNGGLSFEVTQLPVLTVTAP